MMSDLSAKSAEFSQMLLDADVSAAAEWANQQIESGVSPLDFFNLLFTPAMTSIGDMFGRLDIFLPELMDAAETAKAVSEQVVQPRLAVSNVGFNTSRGKIVLCSVKGDLHDIGKNMVKLMLQVNGFEVIDLGIDVLPRDAINKARDESADIIGLSSLMTTSMPYMKETIELRDGFGLKDKFKVIVGGAPITPEYSQQIGADAFGRDAVEGVQRCLELMGDRK
jgi:methylmalonyl-CoA mutase cobalamin-binding domain/chain